MRTQGEHNKKIRLSIPSPSAEKIDSQIPRLEKMTLSVYQEIDFSLKITR